MTTPPALLPRHTALLLLLVLGVVFGANHIAARIAFDHGVGLVTAVLTRSAVTALALLGVVLAMRLPLRPPAGRARWLLALGLLIAAQSLCLYASVARIPVALALLAFNTYPAAYALLSWALGGVAPTRRALALMGMILLGLVLALDVAGKLHGLEVGASFWAGVGFALTASGIFSVALWVTDHRVKSVPGPLRSLCTMALVTVVLGGLSLVVLQLGGGNAAATGSSTSLAAWLQAALHGPQDAMGWLGLAGLTLCYGSAFSILFVLMPRLDMARNAPAGNIEPIAALVMGWLILGQTLKPVQLLGAAVVVVAIVLMAMGPKKA